MKKILVCLLLLCLIPSASSAQRTRLAAALIDGQVLVTSKFNGAKITMFGAVQNNHDKAPDIVVLVRGPDRPAWISKRYKIAGMWVGQSRIKFQAAPTFFAIVSNRPINEVAPNDTLRLYGLTAQSQLDVAADYSKNPELNAMKDAYVEERQRQNLYITDPKAVQYFEGGLFRADIKMPDLTPPGLYTVKVMVFKNRRPIDSSLSTLVVSKVGIERTIYRFSRDHRVIYAAFGVLLAIGAGFITSRIFSRFVNV